MIFKSKRIKSLERRVSTLEETVIKLMLDKIENSLTSFIKEMDKKELKTQLKTKKK